MKQLKIKSLVSPMKNSLLKGDIHGLSEGLKNWEFKNKLLTQSLPLK